MARAVLSRVLNVWRGSVETGGVLFVYYFLWLDTFVKFVVNKVPMLDVHSGGPGEEGK
jgi:hypothetical protein